MGTLREMRQRILKEMNSYMQELEAEIVESMQKVEEGLNSEAALLETKIDKI